jgi:hypothetical protein
MPRHVLVADSDSDEPVALDPPPRRRAGSSQPLAQRRERPAKRGRKKQKTPEEDDEVVFVREEKAREIGAGLASRFAFTGAAPLRKHISASFATASVASTSTLITPLPTPREPLPVPEWLPKTSILNDIPKCVLCQRDFKKAESGAARWVSCKLLVLADNSATSRPASRQLSARPTLRLTSRCSSQPH